jgi:hypothetical protein
VWRAAGGRFLKLLLLASAVVCVPAGLAALLGGVSLSRAVSVGFYVLGSFLLLSGFFVGNRGPVRPKEESGGTATPLGMILGQRDVRWATPEERVETINMSAVFVLLGFVLILIGAVADTRYRLF